MALIDTSGLYSDTDGQSYLLTQGVVGNTLVAGKKILYRLFGDPNILAQIDHMIWSIDQSGQSVFNYLVPSDQLIADPNPPNGPSVGAILPGPLFPKSGPYNLSVYLRNAAHEILLESLLGPISFYPTKDLRFSVVMMKHEGVFAPTQEWFDDADRSMLRLGAMYPVRDGVQNSLNGDVSSGLRYSIGNSCDGWTNTYYDCVYGQTRTRLAYVSISDRMAETGCGF